MLRTGRGGGRDARWLDMTPTDWPANGLKIAMKVPPVFSSDDVTPEVLDDRLPTTASPSKATRR
jgi:hypothetical protein